MSWFNFTWWLTHTKVFTKINNVKYWFYYRFHPSHQYNKVDTGLPAGYYEKDYLILHACFNLLKDYVEKELVWMCLICSDDEKNKIPWWQTHNQYLNKYRGRLIQGYLTHWDKITEKEALDVWCMSKENLQYQRDTDKETRELYYWWINERPNRADPYDAGKRDLEMIAAYDANNKQDEDMLIRLMKIRLHLWT